MPASPPGGSAQAAADRTGHADVGHVDLPESGWSRGAQHDIPCAGMSDLPSRQVIWLVDEEDRAIDSLLYLESY